jgi:hypothetical protein
MKAKFILRLVRPANFISFSNNPKNHTEIYEEYVKFMLSLMIKID